MQNGKTKLISGIIAGALSTAAGIGAGLYSYSWWIQIDILFPAYGGLYARLSYVTESLWIFSVCSLLLLILTCISSTSGICGDKFPIIALVLFIISGLGTLSMSATLAAISTESECNKMRRSAKNNVSSQTLVLYHKWLQAYTSSMSPKDAEHYRLFYEEEVCNDRGTYTWVWLGFIIAAILAGIVFLIFYRKEKIEYLEALEGTPLSQGNFRYN